MSKIDSTYATNVIVNNKDRELKPYIDGNGKTHERITVISCNDSVLKVVEIFGTRHGRSLIMYKIHHDPGGSELDIIELWDDEIRNLEHLISNYILQ